jgi:hypothetical protein
LGVVYHVNFSDGRHLLIRLTTTTNGEGVFARADGRMFIYAQVYNDFFCDIATALYARESDLFPVIEGTPGSRVSQPQWLTCDRHHQIRPGAIPGG